LEVRPLNILKEKIKLIDPQLPWHIKRITKGYNDLTLNSGNLGT